MDVSDAIGHFGPFQFRLLLVLFLRAICAAFLFLSFQLISFDVEHQCATTELEDIVWDNSSTEEARCFVENDDTNGTLPCVKWRYDNSSLYSSVVQEWDLVCHRSSLISFGYLSIIFGNFVAYLPAGHLADKYGRLPVTIAGQIFVTIFTLILAFSNSIEMFLIFRFLIGVAFGFTQNPLLCIFFESVGPKYRDLVVLSFAGFWGIGMMSIAGLSWIITDWRHLLLVSSIPFQILMLIAVCCFVPESIRWMLISGQSSKAQIEIMKRSKQNGVVLNDSENVFRQLKQKIEIEKKEKRINISTLMKNRFLRKYTIILYIAFALNVFIYHGFMVTIGGLGGSIHMNVFLSGSVELPVVVFYLIIAKFFDRRRGLLISYFLSGTLFLLTLTIPTELIWLRITAAMISRFFNALGYTLLYVFSAELFPTELRAVAVSGAMFSGRIGGLLAPFTDILGRNYGQSVPITLYGLLSLLASFTLLLLPETRDKPLPDTVEESEKLSRPTDVAINPVETRKMLNVVQGNQDILKN